MNLLNYNTSILKQASNVEGVWDMKYLQNLSKTWNKWLVHWISQSIAHINLYGDFYNAQWTSWITIHQFWNRLPMWKESEAWAILEVMSFAVSIVVLDFLQLHRLKPIFWAQMLPHLYNFKCVYWYVFVGLTRVLHIIFMQ
jgi:hypothetical protein